MDVTNNGVALMHMHALDHMDVHSICSVICEPCLDMIIHICSCKSGKDSIGRLGLNLGILGLERARVRMRAES